MPAQSESDKVVFLLAEDNDNCAERTQAHLQQAGVHNPLLRFRTGQEVLNFLLKAGSDRASSPCQPFLLLLDVQLPQVDGVQVWQRMKAEPGLQHLPVVMLTAADDPDEIEQGCRLGLQTI